MGLGDRRKFLRGAHACADIFVRDDDCVGTVDLVAADVIVVPVGVDEKFNGLIAERLERFFHDGRGDGFGVIDEEQAFGSVEDQHVVEIFFGENFEKREVAAQLDDFCGGVGVVGGAGLGVGDTRCEGYENRDEEGDPRRNLHDFLCEIF